MNQLQSLLMRFAGRWGRSMTGWAVVSALIWYVLPIVPAFRNAGRRLAAVVVLLVLCVGINVAISWHRRRRERSLAAAIGGEAERGEKGTRDDDAQAEVAALRQRMVEALDRVGGRGRGARRRTLYERPWYVLIGPPGAGKTTALLQSGLHFPLAREMGSASVGGVGGTRLCEWWFADEAVLIDTAGRYTTQDSDAAVDKAGWLGFLDLLRRTRPRQPINGIVVVLSVTDVLSAGDDERRMHARAVRHRIDEVGEQLRVKVPVYVVFSKLDRVQGFDAYFDDLDRTAREQVWGSTFAVTEGVEAFADGFRGLLGRLDARLIERLQAERSAERRAAIGGFPLQMATLAGPLETFLRDAFTGSRLDPAPWLRGVYLTSATQEGTPIDRLTGMLARSFGIDQARSPALKPVSGRAYFVTGIVRDVVLEEALLVQSRPGRFRWRRGGRIAAFAAIATVTAAALAWLFLVSAANRAAIAREDEAIAAYRQSLSTLRLDPVSSDDLPAVSAVLDEAAALDRTGAAAGGGPLGLSQGAKLRQGRRLAYRNALDRILLPRLLWRLETEMQARFDEPTFLYEAVRVYLMLGSAGPLDPALVRDWMAADWASRFPGVANATLRDYLRRDLDAMLAAPLPPVPLDGALVEAARATFSRVTVAERIYSRIRADAESAAEPDAPAGSAPGSTDPDWSPAEALGPLGHDLFTRPSGAPLTATIPGFLTAAGFRNVFAPALPTVTREIASESWVLGYAAAVPVDAPHLAALQQQVAALWVADAERRWDALLDDLALSPLGTPDAALQNLYVLGSPQSPMRDLLVAIVRRVSIDVPADRTPGNGGSHDQARVVSSLFTPEAASGSDGATAAAAAAMNTHYSALRALVRGGAQSPIDEILTLINQMRSELAAAAPAAAAGGASLPATLLGSGDPTASLLAEASRQPLPVSRWLRQIATGGDAALGSAAHRAAATAFDSAGAAGDEGGGSPQALCRSVVDGHYPFTPDSAEDASIDDFARLFGPGGALDSYFQSQVRPYVDTSGATWRPHALDGVAAPVDASSALSFQRAAAIRDAFFLGNGPPSVRFTVRPVSASTLATFSLGSTTVASDASDPVAFTWPVANGVSAASVGFVDRKGKAVAPARSAEGPWALFRLLGEAQVAQEGDPSHFDVTVNSGVASATFELVAGSTRNPFAHDLLGGFKCPAVR